MTRIEQAAAAVEAARAMFADAASLARASHDELVALLGGTAQLARIVEAQQVRLAGEIADRSTGPVDQRIDHRLGRRSAREAVASVFGIRAGDAQTLLTIAATTSTRIALTGGHIAAKYPRVARALDDGDLSLGQARAIVQHLEPAAPRADLDQLAWAEQQLVTAATDPDFPLGPELLTTQARAYGAVLDPDGVLPDAERQRTMRSLRMRRQADGMWLLTMTCTAEAGAAIKALLDAYTSPRVTVAFRDDEPDDTADRGAPPSVETPPEPGPDPVVDDRTPEQKRHDVVVALVQAHAASGDAPVAGGEAPTLVFTGSIDAYAAYVQGTEHPDRSLTIQHTGDQVPIETTGRLLCDAFVQKIVLDEHGHPLALGRAKRLFTPAQHRTLAALYRGCATPGCGMPPAWTEAHHITWWEHGGPTDIDNGILLCSHCHHEVHARRLHVIPATDRPGHWRVVPDLRPADRYARTSRMPAPAQSVTEAGRAAAATASASAARGATVRLAADTPTRMRAIPPSAPPPVPTGALLRRTAAPVEARLRRLVVGRSHPEPRRSARAFDLCPPGHIVMRR